jgi:nitrogen fixation protein NifX
VAFTTEDRQHVDQHFGSTRTFAVYEIGPERAGLLEVIPLADARRDGNEDKLQTRIEKLEGCTAVYCEAVGASAVRRLLARGIQPVRVTPGADIADLVERLQDELRESPSGWFARATARHEPQQGDRFDSMEAEGWTE